jgi:hypothetical protein
MLYWQHLTKLHLINVFTTDRLITLISRYSIPGNTYP